MATSSVRLVIVRGPLWDGEADAAVKDWLDRAKEDLAQLGEDRIRNAALYRMNKSVKRGHVHTGGAASHLYAFHRDPDWIIRGESQQGVVWWPWLEGTSRRNATTRFKGYHIFRSTRQYMARAARKVAQANLNRFIERMGGHIE